MAFEKTSIIVYGQDSPDGCVRLLTSLENIEIKTRGFEVILVLQGVNEKVQKMLRDYPFSFSLQIIMLKEGVGRAAGRILGVKAAKSDLILFLDVDLEISPQLLACHLELYDDKDTAAVMGEIYLPPFVKKSRWFQYLDSDYRSTRRWSLLSSDDASPPLRYVNTANFSVKKEIYERCYEDGEIFENHEAENIDMAYRIMAQQKGLIRYHPEAIAFCQHPGLKASLRAKYEFGRVGVPQLLKRYPNLYPKLPSRFVKIQGFPVISPLYRLFMSFIFTRPIFFAARGVRVLGPVFIAFRMMRFLLQYESVHGVRDALKKPEGATPPATEKPEK